MRPSAPDDEPLLYISPKQAKPAGGSDVSEGSYTIVIEPHDISRVMPDEAAYELNIWTALAWGGRRDWELIKKLGGNPSLKQLDDEGELDRRKGIVRGEGGSARKRQPKLLKRRILEAPNFPEETFLSLKAEGLPINCDNLTERASSTKMEPFDLPQLILKKSWQANTGRLQAVIVDSTEEIGGVVCSQSYVSVHVAEKYKEWLFGACACYNSIFAVYYLLLTSGRLASYRPESLVSEILEVPFPLAVSNDLLVVSNYVELDQQLRARFQLHSSEYHLIEDLVKYTLPDFKGDESSPGRQPTLRKPHLKTVAGREPHLATYCQHFLDVLKSGFGEDKHICATIYQDAQGTRLPVRLVGIHLDWDREESIVVEPIDSTDLGERLLELDEKFLQTGDRSRGGIFFQRIARVYVEERRGQRVIPTIYVVKPDRVRYWTRSAGMRDADEIAADIWVWQVSQQSDNAEPKPK